MNKIIKILPIIISLLLIYIGLCMSNKESTSLIKDVHGVVIYKNEGFCNPYPYIRQSKTNYTRILSIHPNDSNINDFDINVSLDTYSKYNIGDKIIIKNKNILEDIKDTPIYTQDKYYLFWGLVLVIIGIVSLLVIIALYWS